MRAARTTHLLGEWMKLPNVLRPAGRTKGKSFSVLGDEKSIIVRSVRQQFWVLAKLMRSGEFEKLYTQWLVQFPVVL
jgi:hypothetical protein